MKQDIRVQSWYFGGFTRLEMDALIKEQNKVRCLHICCCHIK
jgi:hypothetical protein